MIKHNNVSVCVCVCERERERERERVCVHARVSRVAMVSVCQLCVCVYKRERESYSCSRLHSNFGAQP